MSLPLVADLNLGVAGIFSAVSRSLHCSCSSAMLNLRTLLKERIKWLFVDYQMDPQQGLEDKCFCFFMWWT